MNLLKLILRSLWHFRRQHLAVFAGTLISTAVLTGALIVGDSVKYSLRHLVDVRLGNVRYVLQTGDRFVRTDLAGEMAQKENVPAASLLMMPGMAKDPGSGSTINQVQILGVEQDSWTLSNLQIPPLQDNEAMISESVSDKLGVTTGDEILVRVHHAGVIPLNAPFAQDNNTGKAFRVKVMNIANDETMGRFSLKNSQAIPYNIFVSQQWLSEKLDLAGMSNLILVGENGKPGLSAESLNETLDKTWTAADAGLKIRELAAPGKYELLSERIFIDAPVTEAIKKIQVENEPMLTYLVNNIRCRGNETPYSFVSAVSESVLPALPKENEIVINQWLADDLDAKKGDSLLLSYFVIGPLRKLSEKTQTFRVTEIIPLTESDDLKRLMPDFPGLADAGSCHDWETGVPVDLKKIRQKDEDYWDKYKGTPKAFISPDEGLALWSNNFGNYTAIRFDEKNISSGDLTKKIMQNLHPADVGFYFLPVYQQGLDAVVNSVNFGELFLSLSFFVIAAGILLTALLYALLTVSRKQEAGILASLGFEKNAVIRFRLTESLLIVALGGVAGSLAGIYYNQIMIAGLNTVWQGAVHTDALTIFVDPATVITGALGGIIIAFGVIFFITRSKLKHPASVLVKTGAIEAGKPVKKASSLNGFILFTGFGGAAVMVLYSMFTQVDANSGMFLGAGGLFLTGSLALFHRFFVSSNQKVHGKSPDIFWLSLRNAGRNVPRSLATIALLALGIFTVIVTGANRKTFYDAENHNSSGTGGFRFWIESTIPILHDLNTQTGKEKYNLADEPLVENVHFVQFHALEGDDASCLNLNQVSKPQILGIPARLFDQRKSFSFAGLLNKNTQHPWLELTKDYGKNVIPAVADQTVITWGLMKKTGDTLYYLNEKGEKIKLLLVGGLQSSIFQGNILIDDSIFRANFPSVSGTKIMLADTPADNQEPLAALLETSLADQGLMVSKASQRLAEFNTVTNTYLSVFMALGGLGVLIGTLGLGIVILRNILERRHELALLMAVGFGRKPVFRLVFLENMILLFAGFATGILSAIIGILPTLLSTSFSMDFSSIIFIIVLIVVSGIVCIYLTTRSSLKGKLMEALNGEKF